MSIRATTTSALLLALCVCAGCRTQYVDYHSTADVPYATETTSTQMNLVVGNEEQAGKRGVVVFTAVDNDRRPYVLIAPRTSSSFSYSFDDADLDRSVPLTESETAALVSALEKALRAWDKKTRDESGRFVEFMHAPEQDINRVSQNVVEWHSALRLTISHTPDGPRGRLVVGDSPKTELQHVVPLKKRERIADLRQVLQEARSQLQVAGR